MPSVDSVTIKASFVGFTSSGRMMRVRQGDTEAVIACALIRAQQFPKDGGEGLMVVPEWWAQEYKMTANTKTESS